MELAALIISVLALIVGLASLSWQIAKAFSSHTIQYVPAPNLRQDPLTEQMGKDPTKDFREIGEPLDGDELEYIERMREKKAGRL